MNCVLTIVKCSLFSRLFIYAIQFIFNNILPNHEPNPPCFKAPGQNDTNSNFDSLASNLYSGFKSWDAQYFLHVSKHGYTYENTLAFFPVFPYISYYLSKPLSYLTSLNIYNSIFVTGLFINLISFILTSVVIYYLTLRLFKDRNFAFLTAIVFSFNPASIFFTAFYSESLYCFLTFLGLLCLETGHPFFGAALFGLSGGTRSNGIISCGFVIYNFTRQIANDVASVYAPFNVTLWLKRILRLSVQLFLCLVPFVWFQVYSCLLYCVPYYIRLEISDEVELYAEEKGFKMPSEHLSPWCYDTIPLAYSYVQKEYWNVGFLRYYHWKQIPNFILAIPAVILIFSFSTHKIVEKLCNTRINLEERVLNLLNNKITMYIGHAVALTTFAVLCIHVQVTTRLLCSSSPIIYWSIAEILMPDFEKVFKKRGERGKNNIFQQLKYVIARSSIQSKLVMLYCFIYIFVGTILFSNHYPWT